MSLPFEASFTFRIPTDALSLMVVKLRFQFGREGLSRKGPLLASMPERGRNPLRAHITRENEISN
jgi:hypothetical protein